MSELRIVGLLRAAVAGLGGYTFETGTAGMNNITSDDVQLPVVVFDRPTRIVKAIQSGGGITETYNVNLAIFDKTEFDDQFEHHEPVIFNADQAANQLIINLNSYTDYVKAITNIEVTDAVNVYDVNLSGVVVSFTLEAFAVPVQPCPDGEFVPEDLPPYRTYLTRVYTDSTLQGDGTLDNPLTVVGGGSGGGGGGGSIRIQDDGVTITNAATNLDFRGTGVAATLNTPGDVHIQIDRVNLTAGAGVSVTGTYPNLTVTNTAPATGSEVTNVTASAPISSSGGTTPNISIAQASSSTDGYLSASDWSAFDGKQDALTAGTGISLAGDVVTNTAPDQTVVLNAGTGIGVSGTYPNFTISNTQDVSGFVPYTGANQDVDLGSNSLSADSLSATGTNGAGHINLRHQAANATATGQSTALFADSNGDLKTKNDNLHYSTFKTSGNTADRTYTFPNATGTVALTSDIPTYTGGTGISVAGTTITNTAPDQTVVLNAGVGVAVTGTYPNFTIAATGVQAIKSTTNGTVSSGTTNTVSATRLIAGGTIAVGNVVRITTRGIFTGIAGTKTMRVYLNSTPNLSGSPILLQTVTTATSALFAQRKGDLMVKSATETEFISATLASLFTDESQTSVARSTANIDWTQDWYIVFANQCAAGTDSANTSGYTIEIL